MTALTTGLTTWTSDNIAGDSIDAAVDLTQMGYLSMTQDTAALVFTQPLVGEGEYDGDVPYQVVDSKISFPPGTAVPGPFSYRQGWSKWGGDKTFNGHLRYSSILDHFGHTHIMAVHSKISSTMAADEMLGGGGSRSGSTRTPLAAHKADDMTFHHLLGGSWQIFRWYAGLVDTEGNPLPRVSINPPLALAQRQLAEMFGLLIGWQPESIDINEVPFDLLIPLGEIGSVLATPTTECGQILAQMQTFLMETLVAEDLSFWSWSDLMARHQTAVYHTYELYAEVERLLVRNSSTVDQRQKYRDAVQAANDHGHKSIAMGRQLAAFFGAFYSVTAYYDALLIYHKPALLTAFVETDDFHSTRVDMVRTMHVWLRRHWYEHGVMFDDYARAAARRDQIAMFQIRIQMLESCAHLGGQVGEVFRAFDHVVRRNDLYDNLLI